MFTGHAVRCERFMFEWKNNKLISWIFVIREVEWYSRQILEFSAKVSNCVGYCALINRSFLFIADGAAAALWLYNTLHAVSTYTFINNKHFCGRHPGSKRLFLEYRRSVHCAT